MFSFQIGVTSHEEEVSSADSVAISEEIKAKLQEIHHLLSQDIGQLVQEAELIRTILKPLRGQLPELIEDALIPAAYIESHQVQVLKAKKRLTDQSKQEQTLKERDSFRSLVDATRNQISVLSKSQEDLEKSKDELVTKRNLLLHELARLIKTLPMQTTSYLKYHRQFKSSKNKSKDMPVELTNCRKVFNRFLALPKMTTRKSKRPRKSSCV